ncbi:hypothetical protein D9M68_945970 [compost metagenome]
MLHIQFKVDHQRIAAQAGDIVAEIKVAPRAYGVSEAATVHTGAQAIRRGDVQLEGNTRVQYRRGIYMIIRRP